MKNMPMVIIAISILALPAGIYNHERLTHEPWVSYLGLAGLLFVAAGCWFLAQGVGQGKRHNRLRALDPESSQMEMRFLLNPTAPIDKKLALQFQNLQNAGCLFITAAFALLGFAALCLARWLTFPAQPPLITAQLEAILVALIPTFCLRYVAANRLYGIPMSAYLSALFTAPFGVWLTWHAGGGRDEVSSFSPYWGILPALLVEVEASLNTRMNLIRDSRTHSGSRFVMPDGSVIVIPRKLIWFALLSAAVTAVVIVTSDVASSGEVVAFLKRSFIRWPLALLGGLLLLRLLLIANCLVQPVSRQRA